MIKDQPKRAIIVTHTTEVFGPPNALANYLNEHGIDFLYLDHPLDFNKNRHTRLEIWQDKQKIVEKKYPNWSSSPTINYLKDFFLTSWVLVRYASWGTYSYYFGFDSLCCLPAVWLRFWTKTESLIAYNADYSTSRFTSPLMNGLYRFADRYTNSRADKIWCVTERIATLRKRSRLEQDVVVTPNGVSLKQINSHVSHQKGLVFIGNFIKEKGIDILIRALAKLPRVHLTLYGNGPEQESLETLTKQLGLSKRVTFAGRVSNDFILKHLADYTVGVAIYRPDQSYVYYSDPLKVKEYLAAGLAVVLTDIPEIAKAIQEAGAGVVISEINELPKALARALAENQTMRQAAQQLAKKYDWTKIFDAAFARMGQ